MPAIRLKRNTTVGLLVVDLLVLYLALAAALDDQAPMLFRVACYAVAALAVGLGVHSVVSLTRRRGRNAD